MNTHHYDASLVARLLQELLELHPSVVQGMFIGERYGFACGYLVSKGITLHFQTIDQARAWADHWEDHEIPEEWLRAEANRKVQ